MTVPPSSVSDSRHEPQAIAWRDWSNAIGIPLAKRDEWAAAMIRDPNKLMTHSGDSAVFCIRNIEGGFCDLFDVIVRRTARFPAPPPPSETPR